VITFTHRNVMVQRPSSQGGNPPAKWPKPCRVGR